ncbi:hypothetical protein DFH27DRAFT_68715 [Peziza echinospora]|nr:hypothetical protein DFH27DRAFT_68715 [Peziza echinospora]
MSASPYASANGADYYTTHQDHAGEAGYGMHILPAGYAPQLAGEDRAMKPKQFAFTSGPPPVSLLSTQFQAANLMAAHGHGHSHSHSLSHSHSNGHQRLPVTAAQELAGASGATSFDELDPWYTCMYTGFQEDPQQQQHAHQQPHVQQQQPRQPRPTVNTAVSVYSSPPALSLATNLLGVGSPYAGHHYSAHPDSGIQVTPHTATTLGTPSAAKFGGSAPTSAGGMGIGRPSSTPASAHSPMPMLMSSYPSSVGEASEAWEAHQALRQQQHRVVQHQVHQQQQHQLERAATFDTSSWRIPAYPDVNIVQPTPISQTAAHVWPEPGSMSIKHRSTGLSDAAIAGRGADSSE